MSHLLQDVRFGLRTFRRHPGFAATVIATLGAGTAAATTIFSLVNAVLYAKFDIYREPDRLVYVVEQNQDVGGTRGVSAATLAEWTAGARAFEQIGGVEPGSVAVVGAGPEPESVMRGAVSSGLLSLLDGRPVAGRLFTNADYAANAPVVVLSHGFWLGRFGGNPGVIGRSLKVDGRPARVVGVLSAGFSLAPFLGESPSVYTPRALQGGGDRAAPALLVIGRLNAGATAAEASAQLDSISNRTPAPGAAGQGWKPWLIAPRTFVMSGDAQFLIVLAVGVALVLMMVCANAANLLLARSAGRAKEVATRLAIGAPRLGIARQFLTESLMLGAAGSAVGLFLTWAACRGIAWWIAGSSVAQFDVRIDQRVLLFSSVVSLLMALGVGSLPSVRIARLPVVDAMKDAGSLWGRVSAGRLRRILVAGEVALATVLLVSSGLVLQGLVNLRQNDPGFRPQDLVTLRLTLPDARYPAPAARSRFVGDVLERLESHPWFRSVAVTTLIPAAGSEAPVESFTVEHRRPDGGTRPGAGVIAITPGYFATMGIRVLRGRAPDASDREGSLPTAVVSRGLAERWMNGVDPIGARINVSGTWRTIVGVVGDVRTFHLNVAARPTIYLPYAQQSSAAFWVVLRTAGGDQASLVAAAKQSIQSLDSEQPVRGGEWASALIERSMGGFDMTGLLVGVLAAVAIGLAALGIYGVVAFSVARRTRELGVRIALGAAPVQVAKLVMGEAMKTAAWGAAPGLVLALAAGRLLASKLHRVSPFDPVLLGAVAVAVVGTVVLASWGPARRAALVDPVSAMRSE